LGSNGRRGIIQCCCHQNHQCSVQLSADGPFCPRAFRLHRPLDDSSTLETLENTNDVRGCQMCDPKYGITGRMLHVLGLNSERTGVAVHILLPTAVAAAKSSGSGCTSLYSDASFPHYRIGVPRCTWSDSLEGEMCYSRYCSRTAGACDMAEVLSYAAEV